MKVLVFAASNSRQSINQQLAKYAASLMKDAEIEVLDLNDYEMPIYSSDRENDFGIPDAAQNFYQKIGQADAVIISFAEHNGAYTAAYKNVFDWTSRIDMKVYQDTPALLLATSPGPGGAKTVLGTAVNSAPYFAMDVKGEFSLPRFYDNFDSEQGRIIDEGLRDNLLSQVSNLNVV